MPTNYSLKTRKSRINIARRKKKMYQGGMDIAETIKASGKTRAEICAEAGISQPTLSMVESGKRKIGPAHCTLLARALGVSPADLRPDLAAIFDVGRQ